MMIWMFVVVVVVELAVTDIVAVYYMEKVGKEAEAEEVNYTLKVVDLPRVEQVEEVLNVVRLGLKIINYLIPAILSSIPDSNKSVALLQWTVFLEELELEVLMV